MFALLKMAKMFVTDFSDGGFFFISVREQCFHSPLKLMEK